MIVPRSTWCACRRLGIAVPLLAAVAFACIPAFAQAPSRAPDPPQLVGTTADWLTYNGDLPGTRFSNLTEITRANVARLRRTCTFDAGEQVAFQTSPLVVGGVMYATTDTVTYAIDGATCALRWKHPRSAPPSYLKVNRGAAYLDGHLFRGTSDAHVIALDAGDGHELWDVAIGDPKRGEYVPMAPVAWNGMVFVGNAGGDNFGVTGRVYALDANDGHTLWVFHTVPDSGAARRSWPEATASNPPSGGAVWTSFGIDTTHGILFVSTGNTGPDFQETMHTGQDLYTTSVLALDTHTGRLLAYVKPVKNDFHDWDMAASPMVITTRRGRELVAAAGKSGLLYGIDRHEADKKDRDLDHMRILYETPTTTRTNVAVALSTAHPVRFCPGTQGGTEWSGAAYDPRMDALFVNAVDWCTAVQLVPRDSMQGAPGMPWTGEKDPRAPFGHFDPEGQWAGWITAVNADDGHVLWQHRSAQPILASLTATAGGVLFTADISGTVFALDAATGSVLWRDSLGQATGGGIVSYRAAGHQRIAFAAGLNSPIWPVKGGPARVVVYSLP